MENNKMIIKLASIQDFFTTHTNRGLPVDNSRGSISMPSSFMVKKSGFYPEIKEVEFHSTDQYVQEFDGHVTKVELYSVEPYDDMNLVCNLKKRTIIQSDNSIEVEVIKSKKGE